MSDTTPPPVGPRGLALRVGAQGARAYVDGRPLLACPYGPARPYSRRAWVTGYGIAARNAGAVADPDEVDEDAPWPGDTPGTPTT
jgi:hypothetical protein